MILTPLAQSLNAVQIEARARHAPIVGARAFVTWRRPDNRLRRSSSSIRRLRSWYATASSSRKEVTGGGAGRLERREGSADVLAASYLRSLPEYVVPYVAHWLESTGSRGPVSLRQDERRAASSSAAVESRCALARTAAALASVAFDCSALEDSMVQGESCAARQAPVSAVFTAVVVRL
jgi:hypothetical protein